MWPQGRGYCYGPGWLKMSAFQSTRLVYYESDNLLWKIYIQSACYIDFALLKNYTKVDTRVSMVVHCGLVMWYGNIDLFQHWIRKSLVAWWHQAINCTNVDLPSKVFCGIHPRVISRDMLMNLVCDMCLEIVLLTLQWRHNGRDSVSNHQVHDCLLNRLFRRRSEKTSKLCVTGLCAGNSSVTGEFSAHMASNAENVSIWWRHHVKLLLHPRGQWVIVGFFSTWSGV